MTLDTRVYVHDPISYRETFITCAKLLGVTERHRREDEQDTTSWKAGERIVEPGNPWTIMTLPGQGLPAWLMLHYRPDAPLRTVAESAAHDEYCNIPGSTFYEPDTDECDGGGHRTACWLEISFDTAYSYRDEQGRGCGDLHASVVAQLGAWLDEHGVRWSWKNEFTGEVHEGAERLTDLCSGGAQASAWFRDTVLPAIQREALS